MDLDTALALFANQHRRELLSSLSEREPHERLPATRTAHFGEKEMANLRTMMKHVHLPKLKEADVVEIVAEDTETVHVTQGDQFSEIQPLITSLEPFENELPSRLL